MRPFTSLSASRTYRRPLRRAAAAGLTAIVTAGLLASTAGPARATVPVRCHPQAASVGGGGLNNYYLDDGKLKGAGDNYAGQLGDGTTVAKNLPVEALNLDGLATVATSPLAAHTLALKSDGTVWAWGDNEYGQLGNGELGSGLSEDTPQRVNGVDDIVAVAAGGGHSLALTEDGTVWTWGRNDDGQLGDGGTIDSPVPVQVQGLTDVAAISAGSYHSLAVNEAGEVWGWGDNFNGKLGLGYVDTPPHPLPEKVPGLSGVIAVASGHSHSLALKSDGTAYGWGYNESGAVGDGTAPLVGNRPSPVQVVNLSSVKAIAAGYYHSMALKSDGTVWTWGYSSNGQLGNNWYGWGAWTSTPMQVSGLSGIQTVATPGDQSVAIASDGTIYAWGENYFGQLGLGDNADRATPTALTAIAQSKPAKPANVEAVGGEEVAYLTWEAPASTVTQYVITPYRNGVAEAPVTTGSPKTSHALSGLDEGATYDFEVQAQNCLGDGPASDKSNRVVPTGVQLHDEGFSLERQRINDRHSLSVNVFNGNLKIAASDLTIAGTGLDVGIERAYSSRADSSGIFGNRWSTTVGTDVRIEELAGSDSVYVHTGGGAYLGFGAKAGGGYDPPAGIDATLTKLADATYKLRFHFSDGEWGFGADGKLESRTDRNGNQVTFTYNASGQLTTLTDTQGRDVTFTYGSDGRVSQMTDPLGRAWAYAYDASGNLTTYTDPEGNDTTYSYDADSNLTSVTTPGDPSSPVGTRAIAFTYDASRRVKTVTWPQAGGSPATSLDYGTLETVVHDPNGGETTYHFDEVGRTTKVIDSLGNSVSTEYTSNSNVKRHSIGGATTTYGYSSVNALTSGSLDTGANYTLDYGDTAHPYLPTLVTDPQGNQTALAYDTPGNLASTTNDLSSQNQVQVAYNGQGRATSVTDAKGNATALAYDADGNLTSVDPPAPLGNIDPITYDVVSRVTSVKDGKLATTSYEYDDLDRPTKITHAGGNTVTYTYDGDGNPVSMTDANGTTTMEYDERNLLVSRTTPDGNTIEYGYDAIGNLASITEDGKTTTYSHSAANLLSSVRGPDGAAILISYDRDYNRTTYRYPDGVSIFSRYDDAKRLTKITAVDESLVTLMRFAYSYEDVATGNDTALRQSVTDHEGNVTTYTYDELNRLTRATTKKGATLVRDEQYAYDGNSNRTSQTINDGTATLSTTYAYNAANQLTHSAGGLVAHSYDANGNYAQSSHGERFTFNSADQTVSARTAKGVPATYRYRGPGQAERSEVAVEGVPLTTFTYSPLGIYSETVAGNATTYYVRDDTGQLLAQHGPGGVHYYLPDGLGSTVGLADGSGDIAATYRYDAFGNLIGSSGVTQLTRFRYAGQYLDHTGLYKMGQRYYDPTVGRFTQQDPIHDPIDPKSWNRYVYVGADPMNFVDPSGLEGQDKVRCFSKEFFGVHHPGFERATIEPTWPPFQGWKVDWGKVGQNVGEQAGGSILSRIWEGAKRVGVKIVSAGVTVYQGIKAAWNCRNA